MAITLTDNEFFSGLTDLALLMRLYATNTSRKPKDYVNSFATDTLANGNQKIFSFSDLPTVGNYSETSSLLTVTKVPTNQETIKITEKKVIPTSFSSYILTQAFTSDSGMNEFAGYILSQLDSAKDNYLYNDINTDLFAKTFTKTTQTVTVNLIDTSTLTDYTQINAAELLNQKRIALAVQNTMDNIQVYTSDYNAKSYTQALEPTNLKMVMCNPYHNENIINLFATLLNSEVITKSYVKPELYTIPQIKVPSTQKNVIGWIMHRNAYQFFYKFVTTGSFFDYSNLIINYFSHFWYGKGFIDNLPIIKLVASYA